MDKEYQYEQDKVIKKKKNKGKKKKKKNLLLKIILRFIMLLIIFIVIGIGVLIGYVYNKLSKIDYKEDGLDNLQITEGVNNEGYLNIALFGVDARINGYDDASGSDCIMIISLNKKTKEVRMASVYRDSYLCYQNNKYTKITDIYRKYGPKETVNVLNTNLDLDITEYVAINFEVVADVINYIGGVEVEIGRADLNYINGYIRENMQVTGIKSSTITKAGTYNLDGIQALAYARIRYVGTDINRTARQREVLSKAFDKVKKLNPVKLNGLVDEVLPKVQTTIGKSEIISLALGMTQYNITTSIGFPSEWADYQPAETYYLAPRNLEKNVIKLHKELFDEEDYQVSNTLKKISENIMTKTGIK